MQNEKILVNISEAAEILRVQSNTIRIWLCQHRVLPENLLVRLGRRTLFNREKLIDWVNAGCPSQLQENN